MVQKPLGVAVTGLGVAYSAFLKLYVDAPETELVMLHDINGEWAEKVSREYGGVPWTSDYADVLASSADIVDVSTPNHLHADQTVAALEAGKHVLCQKPMAISVAECRRMVDAARRTGKTLGIIMSNLSHPYVGDLRRMIREGLLGQIAAAHTRNAHREPFQSKGPHGWRAKLANVGGGSLMQLGVHGINEIQYLLDDKIVSVTGYSKNLYCRHSMEGEDVTAAAGELESGTLITMDSGYSSVGGMIAVYGTEGHIVMTEGQAFVELSGDFEGDCISYRRPGTKSNVVTYDRADLRKKGEKMKRERNQTRLFAQAVLAGEPAPVPGETGMRDLAIIQAIYRSAESGRRVEISELLGEG